LPDIISVTEYRVIYGDVDQMGVVYYGNYFKFFERGRAELVRGRGLTYREIEEGRVALPVTEAYCHYHRPARYDDLLLIETRIGQIRRASLRFDYRIFRRAPGQRPHHSRLHRLGRPHCPRPGTRPRRARLSHS
jgi:YbgC/YbaW family acyl-CoA thioester hydrolase